MLAQQDQVSRILHTQQSMKNFLGTLNKQPAQLGTPATMLLQIHVPEATPPQDDCKGRFQTHHHSFQRQVRDAHTWVPCAMCATSQCSTALHYLHLPSMTKPWIPLCASCAAAPVPE